jgi:hypothetical protein
MATNTTLEPHIRDAVTNLMLDDNTRAGMLDAPSNVVGLLRAYLEQALVDPESMYAYLSYLQSLGIRYPFRHSDLMEPATQDRVLRDGLKCLTSKELAELALNPIQLLDLRERLFENETSDYWWPVFRQFNPEVAAVSDALEQRGDERENASQAKSRRQQEQALAGAYFGEQASEQPISPETEPRELWTVSVSLESPSIEWFEVADSQKQKADSRKTVEIVFAWYAHRTPCELEVRPSLPLLLTNRSVCSARLLDSQGHEIRTAEVEAPKLRFVLTGEELSRSATLELDYSQAGRYHLRLQVTLSRPGTAARGSHSLNMTDLALRGRTTELEREFRSCLPALLDRINIAKRERSDALCDALVALVVKNSRNLEGRRFRECLPGWIEEFLTQRGLAGIRRLENEDWEAVLTEVATNRALARVEEALQPKLPSWFADFIRMVKEKPLGERIPLRSIPEDVSNYPGFVTCQRAFDHEATAAYQQLERFWELN